jgi:hypothetical protein
LSATIDDLLVLLVLRQFIHYFLIIRADPVKSRRPDLPITAGSGGRVAASGSTLSSYVIRNLGLSKSVKDDMDPREAILRYAKEAEENPIWVTPAYQK